MIAQHRIYVLCRIHYSTERKKGKDSAVSLPETPVQEPISRLCAYVWIPGTAEIKRAFITLIRYEHPVWSE